MKRLRRKLPGGPILVGLWPSEDDAFRDERVRTVIGADYYSTSLRECVDSCIEAAQAASNEAGGPAVPARSGQRTAFQARAS